MNKNGFFYKVKRKLLLFLAPTLSDIFFLKCLYRLKFGRSLNLDAPKSFNEKLQWLKLYDRRPEYSMMVDKAEVKKYVAGIIGEEHIIPTLAVYNRVEEIDFDALPNQFVLKCTHDSGGIVICKDKETLDKKAAIKKLKKGLKTNYFYQNREWVYKNVKPRIIAEQYMTNDSNSAVDELSDYKWFCFDGEPKAMFIATDRFAKGEETKFDFYDMDFHHLPFTNGHPNASKPISKPKSFEAMKELARKLSKGLPHVRVDFYDVNGHVYFGELTFFHWSGTMPFEPEEWDYKFGEWLKLPQLLTDDVTE
jgi:hypothetical protein